MLPPAATCANKYVRDGSADKNFNKENETKCIGSIDDQLAATTQNQRTVYFIGRKIDSLVDLLRTLQVDVRLKQIEGS